MKLFSFCGARVQARVVVRVSRTDGGSGGQRRVAYMGDVALYCCNFGVEGLVDCLEDFAEACFLRGPSVHGGARRGDATRFT